MRVTSWQLMTVNNFDNNIKESFISVCAIYNFFVKQPLVALGKIVLYSLTTWTKYSFCYYLVVSMFTYFSVNLTALSDTSFMTCRLLTMFKPSK